MYELIWNFLYTYILSTGGGYNASDSLGGQLFNFGVQAGTDGRLIHNSLDFALDPYILQALTCHVLTIIICCMLVFAFIKLIKGLFRVFGGMIKW